MLGRYIFFISDERINFAYAHPCHKLNVCACETFPRGAGDAMTKTTILQQATRLLYDSAPN